MSGAKRLILDDHMRVIRWVSPRIGENPDHMIPAIGIGLEKGAQLVAGSLFTRFTVASMDMHVAAEPGGYSMNKEFIQASFAYPFLQLGCLRVTGLVRADNEHARRFDERLGFKQEGVLRNATLDGVDVIVYGMLRNECRWL